MADWLTSDAPPDRLDDLVARATSRLFVLHRGDEDNAARDTARWTALATWSRAWGQRNHGDVVFDAGTGDPPSPLAATADQRLLVTRPCYLALCHARKLSTVPTAVLVVDDGTHHYRRRDLETALGAPVVATLGVDPAIARAVDSGLLTSRVPHSARRDLRRVA